MPKYRELTGSHLVAEMSRALNFLRHDRTGRSLLTRRSGSASAEVLAVASSIPQDRMPFASLVPDPHAPADWQSLLRQVLEAIGTIRVIKQLTESADQFASLEPVIVAGVTVPAALAATRHDNIILAPYPFAPSPVNFFASTGCLRVLSFSSTCHVSAQRARLPSALFQYFPSPDVSVGPPPERCPSPIDGPPSIEAFGLKTLRSMAHGKCVCVAESTAAFDYIIDGVNGLIGDSAARWTPEMARVLGAAARLSVVQGFGRWRTDQLRLANYIFSSPSRVMSWRWTHDFPTANREPHGSVTPVVTVATVVRNSASDLRLTLPSIVGQRFANKELVLIDGGSTDGTLDVIRDFIPQIDHWKSSPDNGPYDAMKKAADVARGRWILFMNAGDRFVDENALGRLVEAARDDADFVAGHHVYIDKHGIEMINHCVDFEKTYARLLAGDLDSDWVRGVPCHQAVLTRAELIRRHGFDPSYHIAADHEFMYRMRRQGASFQVVPTIVAEYVGGGLSARQEFRCLEEWRRISHGHSHDWRQADRSLDRLLFIAMKALRRQGPFDFSAEPARSHALLAIRIDITHRLKEAIRRKSPN